MYMSAARMKIIVTILINYFMVASLKIMIYIEVIKVSVLPSTYSDGNDQGSNFNNKIKQ